MLLGDAVDPQVEADVLDRRKILVEGEFLGHVADRLLDRLGLAHDVVTRDMARTRRGGDDAAEHPDGRRFPCAVRPQEPENLPPANGEADADRRRRNHRSVSPGLSRRRSQDLPFHGQVLRLFLNAPDHGLLQTRKDDRISPGEPSARMRERCIRASRSHFSPSSR